MDRKPPRRTGFVFRRRQQEELRGVKADGVHGAAVAAKLLDLARRSVVHEILKA
jgi:hypothetical protein